MPDAGENHTPNPFLFNLTVLSNSNRLQPRAIHSTIIDPQNLLIAPETPLMDLIPPISQQGASCALRGENERLLGILSEGDIARITPESMELETVGVREIMTPNPITICLSPDAAIFSILCCLCQHQIRHLPALDAAVKSWGNRGIAHDYPPRGLG